MANYQTNKIYRKEPSLELCIVLKNFIEKVIITLKRKLSDSVISNTCNIAVGKYFILKCTLISFIQYIIIAKICDINMVDVSGLGKTQAQ